MSEQTQAQIQTILSQLSPEERAFFEKDPNHTWLTQMGERLAGMPVAEALTLLKAEATGSHPTSARHPSPSTPPPPLAKRG